MYMILPLSLPQKIGIAALFLMAAFTTGYMAGRNQGREATLKGAVTAYQTREKINHDTQNLDPVALCRALGGMPDECAALLRGLVEAAPD